ncbi:MAG: hypothetical protein P8X74_18705 [Reinekea sp.]
MLPKNARCIGLPYWLSGKSFRSELLECLSGECTVSAPGMPRSAVTGAVPISVVVRLDGFVVKSPLLAR